MQTWGGVEGVILDSAIPQSYLQFATCVLTATSSFKPHVLPGLCRGSSGLSRPSVSSPSYLFSMLPSQFKPDLVTPPLASFLSEGLT